MELNQKFYEWLKQAWNYTLEKRTDWTTFTPNYNIGKIYII